ncbi:MAG TPA: DNA polymerase III subunit epsilon [Acetobacteraceae bacterium]|nr:DNA polymerase III subunit epsilon [Acetobacteraceae bacterium]
MTRSVLLDTETTGLDPALGHRVIEIAAIELSNELPTGEFFHRLLDPGRPVPAEATAIHGFGDADLAGQPRFAEVAPELLAFLGEDPIIAHNAPFDFAFLDAELLRSGLSPLDRGRMVDTLALAKSLFPGLPNTLDALCRRFAIDLAERSTHNALLDCRLLAAVYVELTGGRQRGLVLEPASSAPLMSAVAYGDRTPRRIVPSEADQARHAAFTARLKAPLWRKD